MSLPFESTLRNSFKRDKQIWDTERDWNKRFFSEDHLRRKSQFYVIGCLSSQTAKKVASFLFKLFKNFPIFDLDYECGQIFTEAMDKGLD